MKKTVYHKYINLLRLCLVVAVFLLTFSVNKLTVSAYNGDSLPYLPDSDDLFLTDAELQVIDFGLSAEYPDFDISDPCIIFRSSENDWYDWSNNVPCLTYIVYFPNGNLQRSSWTQANSFVDFALFQSNQYLDINCTDTWDRYSITIRSIGNRTNHSILDDSNFVRFYGSHNPTHVDNGFQIFDYYQYYPCYTNDNFYTNSPVLTNGMYISKGEVVPADPNPSEPDFDDPSLPNKPTKPTIPSPPSKPTINDISDLADYIGDLIIWLGSDVISTLIDYFADLVSYYLASILSAIKKGFDFIFQNIVSFLQPFFESFKSLLNDIKDLLKSVSEFFEKLIEIGLDENGNFSLTTFFHNLIVPSSQDLESLLSNSDSIGIINLFNACENKLESIFNTIINLTPNYRIYVPESSWHNTTIGGFYIDFSWYQDYKVYCDIVISGFLIIGYLYWLYISINGFLRGQKLEDVTEKEKGK